MAYYQSYVIRYVGGRGSGKSMMLAYSGLTDLVLGRRVWSNMPIKVSKQWACYHGFPDMAGRTSEPLDWDALYSLDAGLVQGTVLIDEAQYFSDSRASNSLKNRLLNAIVAQVRKRSLNLFYTVKQADWIDKRLGYETDVNCECSNLSYSEWGMKNKLPLGSTLNLKYYDLSGVITGKAVSKYNFMPYKECNFVAGRMVFDCYDTSLVVDLEEAFTNVKLDLKQRVISNKQNESDIESSLREVATELRSRQGDTIGTVAFWDVVNTLGIEGTGQRLGRYLHGLGITRKQKSGGAYFYDLSKLVVKT